MRIYNALLLPLLTYNIGTLGVSDTDMKALDIVHRKQLRCVLRVHYPNKVSNKALYQRCGAEPISNIALRRRWQLFGHILRLPADTPAQTAMRMYYFVHDGEQHKTYRGACRTTLPALLQQDLRYCGQQLNSYQDLLQKTAQDRDKWKEFTQMVCKADRENARRLQKKRKQKQQQSGATKRARRESNSNKRKRTETTEEQQSNKKTCTTYCVDI